MTEEINKERLKSEDKFQVINEATGKVLATSNRELDLRPVLLRLQHTNDYIKVVFDNYKTVMTIGRKIY